MDYADENQISDLVLLKTIDDKECLRILENRFKNDKIYTGIGEVLVAVNPYKKLNNLYTADKVKAYTGSCEFELPPHVYAIGDRAYRSMKDRNVDQTVIITGESGSGKTESSKFFMQYIAAVSGNNQLDNIKQKLLESNPCLEAFGNAKTLRNDNSSRFGKLMDIAFDYKCTPIGGQITTYLLEKSRAVDPKPGERTFHIFYQLLKGADDAFLNKMHLVRNPNAYSYLSKSGCVDIAGTDDKVEFKETMAAMDSVGISKQNQQDILQAIASILHIGNITFGPSARPDGAALITNPEALKSAAQLLGVTTDALTKALTFRNVEDKVQKTVIFTPLDVEKANDTRDALAKTIYGRIFDCLVSLINTQLSAAKNIDGFKEFSMRHIGVLDIYGFEIFEQNGYDQFLINYCNEKMQQLFIELVLRNAQEEYARENIPWIKVQYFDNLSICQLIDGQPGMIAALNDECLRPGNATDSTWLEKLNSQHMQHAHYSSRQTDKSLKPNIFVLKHYAGNVTYTAEGFIKRNLNPIPRLVMWTLNESSWTFIKSLFPESQNDQQASLKRAETLATQFKQSMQSLVNHLKAKQPHYIRCLKPNDNKQANSFDQERMLHQIRYLGIIENIKVRRAGYCHLQLYATFVERYKCLCPQLWPKVKVSPVEGTKLLLNYLKYEESEFAWGRTKLFVKNPTVLIDLESRRNVYKNKFATKLQALYRGYHQRQQYKKVYAGITRLQACYKMRKQRAQYTAIRKAAVTLNRVFRGWKARRDAKKLRLKIPKYAARTIQKWYRSHKFKKFLQEFNDKIKEQQVAWYKMQAHLKLPRATKYKGAALAVIKFYARSEALKYRRKLAPELKEKLDWKLAADLLFKNRKETYENSIPQQFTSDDAKISKNNKWKHINLQDANVLCAFECLKLHRSSLQTSAKRVLVLTTECLYILESGSLAVKEMILLEHISGISCSTMKDSIFAIHFSSSKKGDLVLQSANGLYPLLSKIYQLLKDRTSPAFKINLTNNWSFYQGSKAHTLLFTKNDSGEQTKPVISRSGNNYSIQV